MFSLSDLLAIYFKNFFFIYRKSKEDGKKNCEPSVKDEAEPIFTLDEQDFVPHFQRVAVSGEDTSGVSTYLE